MADRILTATIAIHPHIMKAIHEHVVTGLPQAGVMAVNRT